MQDVLISYQPITDEHSNMVGIALVIDETQMEVNNHSQNVMSALSQLLGPESNDLMTNYKIFIKVNQLFLMNEVNATLPLDRIVFELDECEFILPALLNRLSALSSSGYCLATGTQATSDQLATLIPYMAFVKVNINDDDSYRLIQALRSPSLNILATDVNDHKDKSRADLLSIKFLQGRYYQGMKVNLNKELPLSVHTILEVIAELNSDGCDARLEGFFRENPALSLQMLKMVNSAAIGAGKEISSIRHAIMILGRGQIMRWLQVMLYVIDSHVKMPTMLLYTVIWRAKFMELMSTQCNHHGSIVHHDAVFITGILSLADMLLNETIESIVIKMSLAKTIQDALLNRTGLAGDLLALAEALEAAEFERVANYSEKLHTSKGVIMACQNEALIWTHQVLSHMDYT
ncbi:EAL and HDOD domain-containing protein [Methylotenera sp.]|uniref:EAL and HDOD domain-containing protein n=1 Tax=Methylotenera sp. TaxID=2051956 RepID=UPI0027357AC8|nr:HDOD domain-containing protein [Methylotenera sp.]MDP3211800.1 HDOD domain-containing protein [Methylotenera sp.]